MHSIFIITSDCLGAGDETLGRRLMAKFLHQVSLLDAPPPVVAFYNGAVKLLVAKSPVLEPLKTLDAQGADLIACGTCVDYFGIREHLAVGRISDMREIVSAIAAADKVVTV